MKLCIKMRRVNNANWLRLGCYGWIILACILTIPHSTNAQNKAQTVAPNEQLSNDDVHKIISLLGEQNDEKPSDSIPIPSIISISSVTSSKDSKESKDSKIKIAAIDPNLQPSASLDSAGPASNSQKRQVAPTPKTPTQEELIQSLSLLNSLMSSGGISPETASLLGLGSLVPSSTTSTTTENPTGNDAAALAILNSLLGAAGTQQKPGNAGGSSSASDAAGLAALLGLAAAASAPGAQQKQQQQPNANPFANPRPTSQQSLQDAQNAALLTNLLASVGQPSAAGGGKQQDFTSFQNAGSNLDSSSSNQLNGALGLLGALSSFASPQPSLFGGGGGQANILSGLLGGGGGQKQNLGGNLLAGLLAPQLSQGLGQGQAQRPGLLSSLGTLASVVGSTISGSRGDGKPRVRGVDTRLGLGYRFGENADAQVVWEIGPQLFTEPLTDEQKQQLALLQQQQQQQQQQQHQQNVNRRLHTISPAKPHQTYSHPPIARRTLSVTNKNMDISSLKKHHQNIENAKKIISQPPTIIHQVMQPPQSQFYTTNQRLISPIAIIQHQNQNQNQRQNYYAKEEANPKPKNNAHSQLTEYERWLLYNPKRDQIHQQQLTVNAKSNLNKLDSFIFTKENNQNIVRVRLQPRENPHQVQIVQSVSKASNNNNNNVNKRMGLYDFDIYRSNPSQSQSQSQSQNQIHLNPSWESVDSYSRRNAMVMNPNVREFERERERQEHLKGIQHIQNMQRRREQMQMQGNTMMMMPKSKSTSTSMSSISRTDYSGQDTDRKSLGETLAEWNEKTSMMDIVQNYVLTGLTSQGNNLVKNFFMAKEQDRKKAQQNPNSNPASISKQETSSDSTSSSSSSSLLPNLSLSTIKDILGITSKPKQVQPTTPKPVIRVGDHVSYDDLQSIILGGKGSDEKVHIVPTLKDTSEIIEQEQKSNPFAPTPAPEIFIDLVNGEVSMRKPFGTMESFEPTTPAPEEYVSEDSPKHVFKILREQLKEEYERVKLEQLKEAAKQRRKENIANGLSNPQDPLYLASKLFDLVEQERQKRNS